MSARSAVFSIGLLWTVLLLPSSGFGAETLSREQTTDLFLEARQCFREALDQAASDPEKARQLYQKAALRLERIAEDGQIHNGKLFYNIGNAYFRLGDIGRAILNYRRAERWIPNDANLRQNLGYARSRRIDRIEEPQRTKVLQVLLFWHYDLSARSRLTLFTLCLAGACLAASLRLFLRRSFLRWLAWLGVGLALLFLGSLALDGRARSGQNAGVILADEVVARKGDSQTYQPSFETPLHAGTEFELLEARQDWYHIDLLDGRQCWVPAGAAGLVTSR
ncbi:MAG: hypothetical protein JW810_09170 [Sedimentisphaerales bacterium]|nr:hypothetical protein [Sedimentisphaerales bacterium]